MQLVGPYLTTTGKRKGKQKFRNAEAARQARQLEQDWVNLKTKWGVPAKATNKTAPVHCGLPTQGSTYIRDTGVRPTSLGSWNTGPVTSKQTQHYTGGNIVGIGTLHKSNAVPIFSDQEAVEIATMRR